MQDNTDRSLRVMCVITAMGCGGAERRMAWLANRLSRRGHRVSLRVLHGSESFFELDPDVDLRFFSEDFPRSISRVSRFFRRPVWLRRQIVSERSDFVLSFIDVANVVSLWAARPLKVPVVVAEHTHPPDHRLEWRYRILRRLLYRNASRVVMLTESSAEWARTWLDSRRLEVIPNSVSPPTMGSNGEVRELRPGGRKWIAAVGRLDDVKGFDKLLAAYAVIEKEHPDWGLVILGEGPLRTTLERDAQRRGIADRVLMPGVVKNPADFLRRCNLFVLSSRYEGFPTALCEAMACGLPVISFDCPVGPGEIIRDGVDGVLVPPGDVAALAESVQRLIEDPGLAEEMGHRATEVVDRFADDEVESMWVEVLSRAQ